MRTDQLAAWGRPQGAGAGLGFAERAPAATFVQSNCKVPSGRTEIVANLMAFGDVAVHSYGKCGPTLPYSRPLATLLCTGTAWCGRLPTTRVGRVGLPYP